MRIAVDGMGGDLAPQEVVRGAVLAAQELGTPLTLVGDEGALQTELRRWRGGELDIEVVHAPERIEMGEHPATALRRKKGASILVAMDLVRAGKAEAVVSAGSTGAAMAASLLRLGRIQGIERPAITTLMPTVNGFCLILDVGANVDSSPQNLLQFARMGTVYAEQVLHIPHPRVGLLSIGEEETKGNELVLAAHALLRKERGLNFLGNIEGRDIPMGKADVVVCDGFVGNVVLKLAEGLAKGVFQLLRQEVKASLLARLGALFFLPSLRRLGRKLDYAEYGGAPLLGVNGITIISHGSSNARAIRNAVRVAQECVQNRVLEIIRQVETKKE